MSKVSIGLHHTTVTDAVKPAAPTLGQTPTATATTITVTITPGAPPAGAAPVTAFYIYQDGVKVKTVASTQLNPQLTQLTPGRLYQVSVSAYNGQEGPRSADLAVSTLTAQAASTPTNLVITSKPSATSAVLSWSASTGPTTDPILGYRVRRQGSATVLPGGSVTGTTATVTGLADGDVLTVAAYNNAGESTPSDPVMFTVDITGGGTLSAALPAGRVAGTYSIAMPKMTGTYGDADANLAALQDIGCKQWRASFQPDLTTYRTRTAQLAAAGLRNIARLGSATAASSTGSGQDTPAQLIAKMITNFGSVAGNLARKVENTFCLIEGLNEPNNDGVPWIDVTVAYTRDTFTAWNAEPQLKNIVDLTGPALARISGTGAEGPTLADQARRFAAAADAIHGQTGQGLKPWVTKGVTHIYPLGSTPSSDYDYFTPIARSIYPTPLQMATTEGGYSTDMANTTKGNPVPEAVEGIYADRHILEHVIRSSLYFNRHELWDDALPAAPTDTQRRESSFGLLRADGSKKPSYATTKNLLGLFTDEDTAGRPKSVRTTTPLTVTISPAPGQAGSTTNTLRAALFHHSGGSHRLVLWRDVPVKFATTAPYTITPLAALTVTVTLPTSMGVTIYQPSVQATPTTPLAARSNFTVSLRDNLTVAVMAPL